MSKTVLADIGGTYVRLAILEGGAVENPQKLSAADYRSFEEALRSYDKKPSTLMIATAAQRDQEGIWHFHNNNKWQIDPAILREQGWDASIIVNDFVASARGAVSLRAPSLVTFREGRQEKELPRVILGPGTGLGLAYMHPCPAQGWRVQQTFGGHMLAAALTDEQFLIVELVRRLNNNGRIVVPEDLVSGRALPVLYRAVCLHDGCEPIFEGVEEIVESATDAQSKTTLRLFHEFLGLFAHNAVVTGHAYGGLYLDGGVLHRLREADLFDFEAFYRFIALEAAPVVKRALEEMPVYLVRDPFVALHGLAQMAAVDA